MPEKTIEYLQQRREAIVTRLEEVSDQIEELRLEEGGLKHEAFMLAVEIDNLKKQEFDKEF